ncbi:MAG: hypothetical protein RL375_1507 [Pseudomonadota bacterium]
MKSQEFELISRKKQLASAAVAVVASMSCLAFVLAIFASASGELDPVLAKLKPTPAASAVASEQPTKRLRG